MDEYFNVEIPSQITQAYPHPQPKAAVLDDLGMTLRHQHKSLSLLIKSWE